MTLRILAKSDKRSLNSWAWPLPNRWPRSLPCTRRWQGFQQLLRHEAHEIGCPVLGGAPDGDLIQLVQHDIPLLKLQPLLLDEVHAVFGLGRSQQLLAILTLLPASVLGQCIWREASLYTLTS